MHSASSWAPSPTRSWCCARSAPSRRGRSCRISASRARCSWHCSAWPPWSGSCTTWPPASTSRPSSTWCTTSSRRRSTGSAAIGAAAAPSPVPPRGVPVTLAEHGYLRAVDEEGLAGWAEEQGAVVVLLVRPGDYLFPGAPVAELIQGRRGRGCGGGDPRRLLARVQAGGDAGPRVRGATAGGGRGAGAVARHQRPVHGHRRARPAGRSAVRDRAAPPARQHGPARRPGGAPPSR